ncbi:hypothetical protein FOCC_FOCC002911, partial [Frankliniella occidentalis]
SAPDGAAAGAGGDGEIVGGPRNPQQIAAQRRLQQTQAQVVDIMKTNVEKVLERDQKLSELDDRADALQQGASQFEQQAGKLKRKFWLQNLKMMIIMGVIGLVILAIIVGNLRMAFIDYTKNRKPCSEIGKNMFCVFMCVLLAARMANANLLECRLAFWRTRRRYVEQL